MKRKNIRRYMMSVLAYYRSEWTDVSDEDMKYRLLVTEELERLLLSSMRSNMNIPNAARRVAILLGVKDGGDIKSGIGGDDDAKLDP